MPATVWKGYLTFGLVTFPVRLYSAARPEAVHFHMLHKKDGSRVKEVWYCAEENVPIDRSEIVKGYEVGKGEYVQVDDADLKKIAPPAATNMEIVQFVGQDEVDPLYFESSYYIAPEEKIGKAFALFVAALKDTKRAAIATVAMHNREHVVLIRTAEGGLLLHTLYYEDELHGANKAAAAKEKYTAQELEMARSLIGQLSAPFKPEKFHDTYRENVERLIEQKSKGKKVTAIKQPHKAPVIDLMEALKKSLAASGKTATTAAKKRPARPARKIASRRSAA